MSGDAVSTEVVYRTESVKAGRRDPRWILTGALAFLVSFLVLLAFWWVNIRAQFSPLSDEFSLFANSARMFHPRPSAWLFEGFSRYFSPYPQWSSHGTDFLRPVANVVYYLASLLFGRHWSLYLLSNYLFQSAIVGLAVFIAGRHLKFSLYSSLGIGLLCFLSPAFGSAEMFSTAFAFDLLGAALVLAGLNELLSKRLLSAGVLFTIALFTKETAFFALLAAAVVAFRMSSKRGGQRAFQPLCLLLPYLAWAGIRLAAFRATVGAYPVPRRLSGVPAALIEDLGRWPFPLGTTHYHHSGLLRESLFYGSAGINFCFWIALLAAVIPWAWRHFLKDQKPIGANDPAMLSAPSTRLASPAAAVAIFCALSSAILLLIPHLSARFGAAFLPLLILCLAEAARRAWARKIRAAAWCFLLLPMVLSLSARALQFPQALKKAQHQWAFAADYIDKISQSRAPAIFTVDDVSGGFSSNNAIAEFAGYRGRLIRVNDLLWRPGCRFTSDIAPVRNAEDDIGVTSRIDGACAGHAFLSADPPPAKNGVLSRDIANGKTEIFYRFPKPSTGEHVSELSISIAHAPPGAVILVPDFSSNKFRAVAVAEPEGKKALAALPSADATVRDIRPEASRP